MIVVTKWGAEIRWKNFDGVNGVRINAKEKTKQSGREEKGQGKYGKLAKFTSTLQMMYFNDLFEAFYSNRMGEIFEIMQSYTELFVIVDVIWWA